MRRWARENAMLAIMFAECLFREHVVCSIASKVCFKISSPFCFHKCVLCRQLLRHIHTPDYLLSASTSYQQCRLDREKSLKGFVRKQFSDFRSNRRKIEAWKMAEKAPQRHHTFHAFSLPCLLLPCHESFSPTV